MTQPNKTLLRALFLSAWAKQHEVLEEQLSKMFKLAAVVGQLERAIEEGNAAAASTHCRDVLDLSYGLFGDCDAFSPLADELGVNDEDEAALFSAASNPKTTDKP